MTKEAKILIAIMAIVVGGGLFAALSGGPAPAESAESLVKENTHTLGEGEVQVVEFGDYQCPACGQANPIVKRLNEEFEGKVTFAYRHFPLPAHQNALAAATAAEAAAEQGKFWEMHNRLFEGQDEWSGVVDPSGIFTRYATSIGLDEARFKEDIGSDKYKSIISADQTDGYKVNVQGTPSFYINGKKQAAFDYDSLKKAIEAELK